MQNLINQLMQPQADGTIKPPSILHRRAGQTLNIVNNERIKDLQARIELEDEHRRVVDENERLRRMLEAKPWKVPEPTYYAYDNKSKPTHFATYTLMQLHEAYNQGQNNAR